MRAFDPEAATLDRRAFSDPAIHAQEIDRIFATAWLFVGPANWLAHPGDWISARLGTLSKGERKRTLLALGLLTPQPLLMLDEPFDGLDLRQTREVMMLLRAHAKRGRTLLLSVHQLTDAARVCDRLVLLSAGLCVGIGTLAELQAQAGLPEGNLEEVFLALD